MNLGNDALSSFKLLATFACVCVFGAHSAHGQVLHIQSGDGAQQYATFNEFKLQSGASLRGFRLGYRTLGRLSADRSNAVLWPTWLGGTSQDLLGLLGPTNVVDSNQYFVILVDSIGNGISTSPSNSPSQPRMNFPAFTIRDMVESERRLVTEVLGLAHLRAVIGLSMGGMQAFEWAVVYPSFMDITVAMAGSPQSTSYDKLLWTAEIDAIQLDPAWQGGNANGPFTRGIALAEEIDGLNATSPACRVAHTPTKDFEGFIGEIRENARSDGGAVSDQIRQRQSIIALDIPKEYGGSLAAVAKRVRCKMLVIVSLQDQMVNPTPSIEFGESIRAPIVSLNSPCGHRSFSCISVGPLVARFLSDPSSVESVTLDDPSSR